MMYIEHTPLELEDNLQFFLRNHVPSSASNSVVAHVQEAEDAATHLQLEARAEVVPYSAAERAEFQSERGSTKTNTNYKLHSPDNIFEKRSSQVTAKAPAAAEKRAIEVAQEESSDEEQEYEVFDVVDVDCCEEEEKAVFDEALGASGEVVFELEKEANEFSYILTKVQTPSSSIHSDQQSNGRPPRQVYADSPRVRNRRPVPAAIPIHRRKSGIDSVRLLNGNLPIFQRCDSRSSIGSNSTDSATFSYILDDLHHRNHQGRNEANAWEVGTQLLENIQDDARDSPMGFDIFNRLRRLISFNSDVKGDSDGHERNRKRRSDNWSSNAIDPRQIKYRKVENKFPKIITHTLEDDDLASFPKHNKGINLQKFPYNSTSVADMTERRSLHSIAEKPKLRKSIFAVPPITHKLVKNTSYADVEFSDDEEPELIRGFGVGNENGSSAFRKSPRVFNIPISHREDERSKYSSKMAPPPLIEAHSGSILASSLMPELDMKRKPASYADVLRQNMQMPSTGGRLLGGRSVCSMSTSGASTSVSLGGINGLSGLRSNLWSTNARSILAQEKETEEREKYQQLLEQVVPRLYGVENAVNRSSAANSFGVMPPRGRNTGPLLTGTARNSTVNRKSLAEQNDWQHSLKRPPLSSTINLDEDEIDDDDDVTLIGVTKLKSRRNLETGTSLPTVVVDDDDASDIIDLGDEERNVLAACAKLNQSSGGLMPLRESNKKESKHLPYVEPVNTLQERFKTSPHFKDNFLETLKSKWNEKKKTRIEEVKETVNEVNKLTAERRVAELEIHERLRKFQIVDPDLLVIDDFPEPEVEEEPEFIELTSEYQARIKAAVCGPPDQVLVSKFNLNITRRDIHTLLGHNWLNDEVINFYMNLLTERGEKKNSSHGLPSVYAFNTFFIPRLLQAGYSGVKRWTRKVDIFSKDIIPVPVHVGGVHWCMAIIHLKNRTIKYYDSMGTPNPNVLKALEQYLREEAMDKRKQPFDTSHFEVESVRDVPRQMNGSDCGVFSCMFAEYITRNREITFSQQNMEYFRHKMVLEIVQGELLH